MQKITPISNAGTRTAVQTFSREAKQHPLLSADEEYRLAIRYRDFGDEDAKERLINSHLRLVVKIAHTHAGYKVQIADLISEGNVGLMKALAKFDPEKGNRFSTYAIWWIRAQIREYSMHSYSQVKMGTTAAQKKLFFNLSRILQKLEIDGSEYISLLQIDIIAESLSVPRHEVLSMVQRLSGRDASLQSCGDGDDGPDLQDKLVDNCQNPEEVLSESEEFIMRRDWMVKSLEGLSQRERVIFEGRHVSEDRQTLENLSQKFGISRERVRQIETRAFEKIRKSVRNLAIQSTMAEQVVLAGLS